MKKNNFYKVALPYFLSLAFFLFHPAVVRANLEMTKNIDGTEIQRSLESLRDLDYQSWQVVAYPKDNGLESQIVLRIVGFPGSLRLSHPANLIVESGINKWSLQDVTLQNKELSNDSRDAAAEFNLQPLLSDLKNSRPLRLFLPGAINELPIPPYIVKEWRSLSVDNFNNE